MESVGSEDALEELPGAHAAPQRPPVLQDPRGDPAPPDHPRAGGEGRARQQRRGPHDLSVARRPLHGADAEHGARRRHLAQDHPADRPQAPARNRRRARSAGRHGPDHPHGGRTAHQDRDQARLRLSPAAVGDRARPDAEVDGAGPRLRGRQPDQAVDPRSLQQGHRRGAGGGRRGLSRRQGLHAHAHAEPCEEREALQGARARLHPLSGGTATGGDVLAASDAQIGRLYRHQPDRGARLRRRELRQGDPRTQYRGHGPQDQSRGVGRARPAATLARSRRPDRHRLSSTWTSGGTTGWSKSA